MNAAPDKQKQLLNDMEAMVNFFASKKYLVRGTQSELRRYDKYARIMREQLTKETGIYAAMKETPQTELSIHEQVKTPQELYIDQLESRIIELEKSQEKKVKNEK